MSARVSDKPIKHTVRTIEARIGRSVRPQWRIRDFVAGLWAEDAARVHD